MIPATIVSTTERVIIFAFLAVGAVVVHDGGLLSIVDYADLIINCKQVGCTW